MRKELLVHRQDREHARAMFRLRSLRHLKIVRAFIDDPDFSRLVRQGMAERRYIKGRLSTTKCDFEITPDGLAYAEVMQRPCS